MNSLDRFCKRASLCGSALLLCFSLAANADEIQDINKLFKQGKQAQALEKVNTYLAGKPKDTQARFLKGLILTEQGKNDDAIRVFTALTEDFPELPEPYNNLAVLYAGQGQYEKAKIALEMAIRTHPSYATAHENLGDIYAKMASQAYDRALQLDKSNPGTQTKLSLIKDLFATSKSGKAGKPARSAATEPVAQAAAPVAAAAVAAAPSAMYKPGASAPAGSADGVIQQSVNEWAAAWSSKDVKGYLAHYAPDFKTPNGESRSDWEAMRNDRINKPKSINVSISGAKVQMIDDSHATVTFKQNYKSNTLNESTHKTLKMVKSGDKWLIQEERSGK